LLPGGHGTTKWRLGGEVRTFVTGNLQNQDIGVDDADLPALRVTVLEAHACARWLGGWLPEVREWNKAAGFLDESQHPDSRLQAWEALRNHADKTSAIAVGREALGPMPLNLDTSDVSLFGCRHMSGNGREWTNTMAFPDGQTVAQNALEFPLDSEVMLRGQSYRAARSYTSKSTPASHPPLEASSEIGFRVILHP
jgi:formylglycine-generating enzyme required for sulfatase activity